MGDHPRAQLTCCAMQLDYTGSCLDIAPKLLLEEADALNLFDVGSFKHWTIFECGKTGL